MSIVEDLRAILGASGVLGPSDLSARSAGAFRPDNLQALALARPASTSEVSDVLRWCNERGIPVVTQGGLTGLVRGADAGRDELILSLERMRTIESINATQRTATVQAGVTLQALQEAVEAQDMAYPLDLGARGTATLGGTAATNAGGNRVIRYGMTRDMVLGIEAVLADGTVVSSLNPLIKNNTGYDLKQLFIGSEGTLGVITRLVLRLRERPSSTNAAVAALESLDNVAAFLRHMDRSLGGSLSAFEVMWQSFYRLVTTPPAKGRPPVSQDHAYYVLVESQGSDRAKDGERFEDAMATAFESRLIEDAAIAKSEADCQAFWSLRDDVEQVTHGGLPMAFDVSLPIGDMAAYVHNLQEALPAAVGAEHRLFVFGHLGDGNLHIVVQVPLAAYSSAKPKVDALVYDSLRSCGGSVSAEHGIGFEKKAWLSVSRNEREINVMRGIKRALDPRGILNPGKLFDLAVAD